MTPSSALRLLAIAALACAAAMPAQAQTYFNMSSGNYSESFTGWTNYPVNWNGLATNGTNVIPSPIRISTSSLSILGNTNSPSGGIQSTNTSTVILFLSTGPTDNTSSVGTDLNLNFSNRVAGTMSFDAATVFNSTGNRAGTLRVYFATNSNPISTNDWTEITGGGLPYVAINEVAGSASINAALPSVISSNSTVKLRFYYANGTGGTTGSRPKISIDNLLVTSTPASANAPTIAGFSPSGGAFGSSVVITGTNFSTATAVAFNGASASFTVDSATQITATVPNTATTGLISVTNPDGTAFSASAFVVPTVAVILPSSILEGSTGTGELTVTEILTNDITVVLSSSSSSDLTVETPVTIFEGTTNRFFSITAPTNSSSVTNTVVTVTPSATNYAAAPATITVINTDAVKIPLTTLATNSYVQNFNTLGTNTWTNLISATVGTQASLGSGVSTNLNGWFATFLGGTPNTNLVADDGNGTNTAVYNYGNTGGTNRSLGGLANSGAAPAYGALISNSTSDTLRSVVINLTGKFWRSSSSVQNFLSFGYGEVDGTVVNNINFLTATNTNNVFRLPLANVYGPNPVPTNAVGPLDGNNITNQVQISNVAIPVDLAPGETMFIRWQDFDNSGFDAGLAIDDVSLTASTNLAGPVLGTVALDNLTILQDAATVSSSVLTDGGSALTSRGFVFSETFLNTNPVIGGPNTTVITNLPADVSAFTNTLSGLLASTSYTVKSFAISAAGTNYSPAISFNTLAPSPSFTGVYTQSFNGLTNTDLPSGWRAVSTGGIDSYAGDWNTAGSSGGFYGRTNIPGILGYRHTAATGILTNRLTLINNTGGTLTNLWVSYQGEVNTLTNTRFPAWTVVVQGQTNASLAYSTGAGSNEFKSAEITGLNISNGETITIGWWSDRGTNAGGSSRLIGMTDVRVATNAPPIGTPTITVTGSFTNFTTTVGTASASQSIVASGTNLVGDIEVTTPAFYQVSTDNTNFSGALNLAPSGGVVSNTTLFVRLAANAPVGSPAGTVLLGSTNATIQTRAVTGTVFSTYTAWLNGAPTNTANLLKYAIGGASSPTATDGTAPATAVTSSNLSITAIVRTNDPALDVIGEGLTNLSVGPWSTNGVTQTVSTNQAGVPTGTERQIFSIPRGTNTSQFLRLDSILQP